MTNKKTYLHFSLGTGAQVLLFEIGYERCLGLLDWLLVIDRIVLMEGAMYPGRGHVVGLGYDLLVDSRCLQMGLRLRGPGNSTDVLCTVSEHLNSLYL